jgi:hypothetical protein
LNRTLAEYEVLYFLLGSGCGIMAGERDIRCVDIALIRRDGNTQHRLDLDEATIAEWAEEMRAGAEFPPITLWWDGDHYWLSDGFRRIAAAELAGLSGFNAEVCIGTLDEARWHSYGANATHGLRRSVAETEVVLRLALMHPNAGRFSNVQIAKHLHVSEATVRSWSLRLALRSGDDAVREVTRLNTTYVMDTRKIGRTRGRARKRNRRDLLGELALMRIRASEDVCCLLNILEYWIKGASAPETVLRAVEKVSVRWQIGSQGTGRAVSSPH